MAITIKTHKTLWGRSGNRCAYPHCGQLLSEDGASGAVVIGEEAHIVAREPNGPRGNSSLTIEERNSFENLILLCPTHHTRIDGDPTTYSVDVLIEMKRTHEASVLGAELPAAKRERLAEEIYAEYVDEWAKRLDLDHWQDWASLLMMAGRPGLARERLDVLDQLRHWLLGRVWPRTQPDLENALLNFRIVLDDLIITFESAVDGDDCEIFWTRPFYKIPEWDPPRYERLLDQFKDHVALVQNLAYELTRSANFVCDQVRETLDQRFRLDEGALLISTGLYADLTYQVARPEYRGEERDNPQPYPGLERFREIASNRDFSVRPSDF